MIGRTNRRLALASAALVVASFVAPARAHAYERVKPAEVSKLSNTKVWVEVPCEVRQSKPFKQVRLFVGQEVTMKGRLQSQIDAWCIVQTQSGEIVEVMVKNLSAAKPAYSMLEPGKIEEFLPKVAAEAFELPLELAELWKSHDYDLDKDDDARDARECYEDALNFHKMLLSGLVSGSNTSKENVLGSEEYKWLWTADKSVMDAYVNGITYSEAHKKSGFAAKAEQMRDAVGAAQSVSEAASDTMMVKSELRGKAWRDDIAQGVPQAQRDALDREEMEKREKRVKELEGRMTSGLESAERMRKAAGF